MSELTTTQMLAGRAGAGDCDALEALARRTYPGLLSAARAQIRGHAPVLRGQLDSTDLAQSSYLEALRALPFFEPRATRGAFRVWLRGVLLNKVRRRLQYFLAKRRNVSRAVPMPAEFEGAGSRVGPLEELISLERRRGIQRAMATLSERQQKVIQLRFFETLSWDEVGSRMDLSAAAAQMLCHRALKGLRAAFDAIGG